MQRAFIWLGVVLGLSFTLMGLASRSPAVPEWPSAAPQQIAVGNPSSGRATNANGFPSSARASLTDSKAGASRKGEAVRAENPPIAVADPTPAYFRASLADAGAETPMAFPPDAPEEYTPKGFERVSHQAAQECGMGLDVVAIDCSEFPCIAWTMARNDNVAKFSMTGCGPWEKAFANGTVVVGSLEDLDGGTGKRFFSWMAVPPDPADLRIAMKRAQERNAAMIEALGQR